MRRLFTFIIAGFVFSNVSAQTAANPETSAGSEQITEAIYAKAYPNPASSKLHFNISDKMVGQTIQVINVLGSEVLSYELLNARDALDVSSLQTGIYLYRIVDKNDKIIMTGKFNKE